MRTRDEAWQALDHNFKALMDCMGQLTEEELTASPVLGKWTFKDVIAHIWSWADEAAATAKAWETNQPRQHETGHDDHWNEAKVAERAAMPLITVVDGLTGAHRRLVHLLDLADEAALVSPGRAPWGEQMTLIDFFYAMGDHYQEHISGLKEYQEKCLDCD